ncbi:MAG: hypothetical protein IPO58_23715 [Betaproteobacteria bacterium]|nr:hypothetical protein [Betaproteobacteria bacterium]
MAQFPDYLVCVDAGRARRRRAARLLELLSAACRSRSWCRLDDILEATPRSDGHLNFGSRAGSSPTWRSACPRSSSFSRRHPTSCRFRERVRQGFAFAGPALFSVFSGATANAGDLPPYLVAAAAMESRAFPAFTFDPSARRDLGGALLARRQSAGGQGLARSRGSPTRTQERQRAGEEVAFTLVHFVACDRRYARHFARVPVGDWNAKMVPVGESLAREQKGLPETIPTLLMVDADNGCRRCSSTTS